MARTTNRVTVQTSRTLLESCLVLSYISLKNDLFIPETFWQQVFVFDNRYREAQNFLRIGDCW